jgi:hypothetical protein
MSDSQATLKALKSYTFTSKETEHFSDLPSDSLAKRFLSYSTKQILNLTKTEIKTLTGHPNWALWFKISHAQDRQEPRRHM